MIRRILREAVRNVLSEQTLGQKVDKELNAGNKNYINAVGECKNIAQRTGLGLGLDNGESFAKFSLTGFIADCDPTVQRGRRMLKSSEREVGKYADWIVKYYFILREKDRRFTYTLLKDFDEHKNVLKSAGLSANIWDYDPNSLYSQAHVTINKYKNSKQSLSMLNNLAKYEGQYDVAYDGDRYVIVYAKTWEADRFFGSNTAWCTVGDKEYFDSYHPDGYWIVIPKDEQGRWMLHGDERLQFHFSYDSAFPSCKEDIPMDMDSVFYCCDADDEPVDFSQLPEELKGVISDLLQKDVNEYDTKMSKEGIKSKYGQLSVKMLHHLFPSMENNRIKLLDAYLIPSDYGMMVQDKYDEIVMISYDKVWEGLREIQSFLADNWNLIFVEIDLVTESVEFAFHNPQDEDDDSWESVWMNYDARYGEERD